MSDSDESANDTENWMDPAKLNSETGREERRVRDSTIVANASEPSSDPAIIMAAIVLLTRPRISHLPRVRSQAEHAPMTKLGRSIMSLRIEKQKVHGTGAPLGLRSTQCEYTDCVVFSNAWFAKFSQYSTTDWFSNSCCMRTWAHCHGRDRNSNDKHSACIRARQKKAARAPRRCTCASRGRRAPRVPSQ